MVWYWNCGHSIQGCCLILLFPKRPRKSELCNIKSMPRPVLSMKTAEFSGMRFKYQEVRIERMLRPLQQQFSWVQRFMKSKTDDFTKVFQPVSSLGLFAIKHLKQFGSHSRRMATSGHMVLAPCIRRVGCFCLMKNNRSFQCQECHQAFLRQWAAKCLHCKEPLVKDQRRAVGGCRPFFPVFGGHGRQVQWPHLWVSRPAAAGWLTWLEVAKCQARRPKQTGGACRMPCRLWGSPGQVALKLWVNRAGSSRIECIQLEAALMLRCSWPFPDFAERNSQKPLNLNMSQGARLFHQTNGASSQTGIRTFYCRTGYWRFCRKAVRLCSFARQTWSSNCGGARLALFRKIEHDTLLIHISWKHRKSEANTPWWENVEYRRACPNRYVAPVTSCYRSLCLHLLPHFVLQSWSLV